MDTYSETMSLRTESFLVGLIGDGITSSLTPPMHEAEADAHGCATCTALSTWTP